MCQDPDTPPPCSTSKNTPHTARCTFSKRNSSCHHSEQPSLGPGRRLTGPRSPTAGSQAASSCRRHPSQSGARRRGTRRSTPPTHPSWGTTRPAAEVVVDQQDNLTSPPCVKTGERQKLGGGGGLKPTKALGGRHCAISCLQLISAENSIHLQGLWIAIIYSPDVQTPYGMADEYQLASTM